MSARAGGEKNDALAPDFLDFITCLNARDVDCDERFRRASRGP